MANIAKFYMDNLKRWEAEAVAQDQAYFADVGKALYVYVQQCAANGTIPSFRGLFLFLGAERMGVKHPKEN